MKFAWILSVSPGVKEENGGGWGKRGDRYTHATDKQINSTEKNQYPGRNINPSLGKIPSTTAIHYDNSGRPFAELSLYNFFKITSRNRTHRNIFMFFSFSLFSFASFLSISPSLLYYFTILFNVSQYLI